MSWIPRGLYLHNDSMTLAELIKNTKSHLCHSSWSDISKWPRCSLQMHINIHKRNYVKIRTFGVHIKVNPHDLLEIYHELVFCCFFLAALSSAISNRDKTFGTHPHPQRTVRCEDVDSSEELHSWTNTTVLDSTSLSSDLTFITLKFVW